MITLEQQQYVVDSCGNPIAVLLDISAYEEMTDALKKAGNVWAGDESESENRCGTHRSASDIFGMLRHRRPMRPVSADEMNEAIRRRGCGDDCA